MEESAILRTLQAAVRDAVAQSVQPTLPISYVEVKFTKPQDGKWLEIIYIPNNIVGGYWDDGKDYRGLLRLVLHWPTNGGGKGGPYGPLDLLGSIGAYFTNGLLLSGVQIYGIANLTGIVQEEGETLYPVSIRYQSYRKG